MMIRIITGWQGESIGIDSTGNDGQRLQTYTAFFSGLYTDERVWEFSQQFFSTQFPALYNGIIIMAMLSFP